MSTTTTTTTPADTLGAYLDGEADNMARIQRRVDCAHANSGRLLATIRLLDGCTDIYVGVAAAQDRWPERDCLDVSGNMNKLDGFKDQRLIDVLERLTDQPEVIATTEDYADSLNRDFHFRWTDDGVDYRVSVRAYVRSDSATCRKVVVGEDRIDRVTPRYAIVCD